jgi:heterotetrameric sarcosine oxidase delta subunit
MLLIICPHCGPRNSDEFVFKGERGRRPPVHADAAEWRSYLYLKDNAAGWQHEQWFHVAGCRRFLNVERHTISNEIRSVGDAGEAG